MRLTSLLAAICAFAMATPAARSQETFNASAAPDAAGPTDEKFDGGDKDDGEPPLGHEGGPCTGINRVLNRGRCNPRQLPSYTGCGPYYNDYSNYVRETLKHFSGLCEVRGSELWCHQRIAGMCNPSAGGLPEDPLVDSGMRLTPSCEMVCQGRAPPPSTLSRQPPAYEPIAPVPSPPTCDMPSLEQLAEAPLDGDVAVAYLMAPDDGDIAIAQSLAPEDGDIAVALALPDTLVLKGGAMKTGVFVAEPPPVVLRGKASVNGWRMPPAQPAGSKRLQGYATKSIRIPATYKPSRPKSQALSPQTQTTMQLVLSGGVNKYDPDVGRERFISGFLQGMAHRMQELTNHFEEKPRVQLLTEKEREQWRKSDMCQIHTEAEPVFEDAIVRPAKKPTGAAKFIVDMVEAVVKHGDGGAFEKGNLAKALKYVGPLVSGADFINTYRETFQKFVERDEKLMKALEASPTQDVDPAYYGYLAGEDSADAYSYMVKSVFSLVIK